MGDCRARARAPGIPVFASNTWASARGRSLRQLTDGAELLLFGCISGGAGAEEERLCVGEIEVVDAGLLLVTRTSVANYNNSTHHTHI